MTKANKIRKAIAVGVAAIMSAVSLQSAQHTRRSLDDWTVLSRLPSHSLVTIKPFKGRGKKVQGGFLSSDANTITVRSQKGEEVTVARADVKRILIRRPKGRAPWYGAAAGAGAGAAWAAAAFGGSGESGEAAPLVIASTVTFAGLGAIGGLLVKRLSRDRVVYQAAKP